jgi:lipopolysaccharide/colanic/teichoic acid biosynthesis glycosyltransferase
MYLNSEDILESYFIKNSDAKRIWEEKHKLYNDPRVNKFGKFLRKFSLDELPQIFNVLKGNMSLVGPRPIVLDEIKKYGSSLSFYKKLKPGITGLWQVSGRNDLSYSKRVQLDVFYIQNVTFFMDLSILLKTFPAIFFKKGAY